MELPEDISMFQLVLRYVTASLLLENCHLPVIKFTSVMHMIILSSLFCNLMCFLKTEEKENKLESRS